jgi:phage minor structural protein
MIQVYAAGELTYDSRLQSHSLLALSYTAGLNKAGTATITMPPGHPAYNVYEQYKQVISIYDNGRRVFRGRALKPDDDMLNRRTITCEGERCFFRDALMRPYLYQAPPDVIFADIIDIYNSQVEADKCFVVGTVTVTDANNYVRLEAEKAEQVSDTLDKLVKRCGGYIVFTDNENGDRVVSWLEKLNYSTNQTIDFGSNLVDFKRSTANNELATRIVPYGAKNEETGEQLTIESVNGGLDYIEDAEAIALRGIITKPVHWDDVTEPLNLLRKAQEFLESSKKLITGLTLTAADLSAVNANFDAFREGDLIRVRSKPHNLDDDFLLTDLKVDLLKKGSSNITLGKDVQTLTGLSSKGDQATLDELRSIERNIRADYKLNISEAIAATSLLLTSLIEQTEDRIRTEVSETYATNGEVESKISTEMSQLSNSFTFTFNQLRAVVDENDATARKHIEEQEKYIRFENGDIILGQSVEGSMTLTLENDLIVFKKNGATFGWWDGVDFHTGNIVIEVNERAQFGAFAAIPRSGGNLSWLKVK